MEKHKEAGTTTDGAKIESTRSLECLELYSKLSLLTLYGFELFCSSWVQHYFFKKNLSLGGCFVACESSRFSRALDSPAEKNR